MCKPQCCFSSIVLCATMMPFWKCTDLEGIPLLTRKKPAFVNTVTLACCAHVSFSLFDFDLELFSAFSHAFSGKKTSREKKNIGNGCWICTVVIHCMVCLMQLHIRPPPMHDYLSIDFVSGFKHDWQEHSCADSDGPTRLARSACIYPALTLWITFVLLSILYEVKRVTG